ncbi:glycosyltransferase family 9 protein [Spirochaetota bacterium]
MKYFIEHKEDIHNILIMKLDHIGDFVIAMPVIQHIREYFSKSEIHIATGSANSKLAELFTDKDKIYSIERYTYKNNSVRLESDRTVKRQIKKRITIDRFDLVIDLRYTGDCVKFLHMFTRAYKIGFRAHAHFHITAKEILVPSNWHDTRLKDVEDPYHIYRKYQYINEIVTGKTWLSFELSSESINTLLGGDTGKDNKNEILIHFNAGVPSREIPEDYIIQLIKGLISKNNVTIKLIGTDQNKECGERIVKSIGSGSVINTMGEGDIISLFKAIYHCSLLITSNSGPMHIAALLKRPLIALFSYTELPALWAPFQWGSVLCSAFHYPCKPCHFGECSFSNNMCIIDIPIQKVVSETEKIMKQQA